MARVRGRHPLPESQFGQPDRPAPQAPLGLGFGGFRHPNPKTLKPGQPRSPPWAEPSLLALGLPPPPPGPCPLGPPPPCAPPDRRRRHTARAVSPARRHRPLCTMWVGPGMELHGFKDACPPQKYYVRRKFGPPGGALCTSANATDLAHCPVFD